MIPPWVANVAVAVNDLTLHETSDLCLAMQKIASNDPMARACLALLLRYGLEACWEALSIDMP